MLFSYLGALAVPVSVQNFRALVFALSAYEQAMIWHNVSVCCYYSIS